MNYATGILVNVFAALLNIVVFANSHKWYNAVAFAVSLGMVMYLWHRRAR
jgi:hypothetical protein